MCPTFNLTSRRRRFACFFPHRCTQVDDSLQYYELIFYHTTVPLGSNLSLLQSLSASFTTSLTAMRGPAGGRQPAAKKPPWYIYILYHSFFRGFGQQLFSSRPRYAILGTGIVGQLASLERHLRGVPQTPLALPCPFRTWPGSGTWAERDKRDKRGKPEVRKILYFGPYMPELFLDLGIYMRSLNEKKLICID